MLLSPAVWSVAEGSWGAWPPRTLLNKHFCSAPCGDGSLGHAGKEAGEPQHPGTKGAPGNGEGLALAGDHAVMLQGCPSPRGSLGPSGKATHAAVGPWDWSAASAWGGCSHVQPHLLLSCLVAVAIHVGACDGVAFCKSPSCPSPSGLLLKETAGRKGVV